MTGVAEGCIVPIPRPTKEQMPDESAPQPLAFKGRPAPFNFGRARLG
jgi:hypothetical protein